MTLTRTNFKINDVDFSYNQPEEHISTAASSNDENVIVIQCNLSLSVTRIRLSSGEDIASGPGEFDQVQNPNFVGARSLTVGTTEDDHSIPDHRCAVTRDRRRRVAYKGQRQYLKNI